MKKDKKALKYRMTRSTVRFFYRKYKIEMKSGDPALYIGNHCQLHGPLAYLFYFPAPKKIWAIGDMFDKKTIPAYAYEDFFRNSRPVWFFKLLSKLIAGPFAYLMRNSETIAVYKDMRALSTLKNTVKDLKAGNNIVIMPECRTPYNHVLYDFQENYIEIARLYYKSTSKRLQFYPTYLAPKRKRIVVGEPIAYDPENPLEEEKKRINDYLKEEITKIYESLPKHKVVMYMKK